MKNNRNHVNNSAVGSGKNGDAPGNSGNSDERIEGDRYQQGGNIGIGNISGGTIQPGANVGGVINSVQVFISISDEFVGKYILEYVRTSEKRILQIVVGIWIVNLLLLWSQNFFDIEKIYVQSLGKISYAFTLLSLAWILCSILIRNYKNSKTFWRLLSRQEKELVVTYLEEYQVIMDNSFGCNTFDPETNYVSLSGSLSDLYPHRAYEENLPSGRRHIENLDRYLLHPEHKRIFVYGTPGSGKSTTLYKTFLNYKKLCVEKRGSYIPAFIHASQIAIILQQEDPPLNAVDFFEKISEASSSDNRDSFVKMLRKHSKIKLVLIIDALDEFVDKKYRNQLFNYLAKLIEANSISAKWILSCREEEYRAYSDKLAVLNVRVQPMNLSQFKEFLKKRLKSFQDKGGLTKKDIPRLRRNVLAVNNASSQRETFLNNPYYLTLWLYELTFSDKDWDSNIPSIDKLHKTELKREIKKGMCRSPTDSCDVEDKLVENTITVLSVLSFHLLKVSLEDEAHQGVSLSDLDLIKALRNVLLQTDPDTYDRLTLKRYKLYHSFILEDRTLQPVEGDLIFAKLIKTLKLHILSQTTESYKNNKIEIVNFLVLAASIIDQANTNRLIKLEVDGEPVRLLAFFNQRARDYLTARYLKIFGLDKILRTPRINFWLSRSIAISIAITEDHHSLLPTARIPKDAVLESAIVDGLTLIPSKQKPSIANFVNQLTQHLLNEDRLRRNSNDYDPCDPLRVLREVRRLCLNGYSPYINLPIRLFQDLLKDSDVGISESATITLLTYACQMGFKSKLFRPLLVHFLRKALRFELLSEGSLMSFWLAIKEARL
jgi:NACHT domain